MLCACTVGPVRLSAAHRSTAKPIFVFTASHLMRGPRRRMRLSAAATADSTRCADALEVRWLAAHDCRRRKALYMSFGVTDFPLCLT